MLFWFIWMEVWMNIIFSILAFSNADLRSEFECIAVFDRSHMVFSMHIILGSVKLNLKLHTRKSKHTHTKCANWQGGVCLRIYHRIRIKVNTYYQYLLYLQLWTWPQAYCTLFTTRVCKVSQLQIYYDNNLNHSPHIYSHNFNFNGDIYKRLSICLFVQCNNIFKNVKNKKL